MRGAAFGKNGLIPDILRFTASRRIDPDSTGTNGPNLPLVINAKFCTCSPLSGHSP